MSLGKNILIIVSERIGDVIFYTPAISLLRASKPNINIDILALSPYAAQVFEHNPDINNIYINPEKSVIKKIANQYDTILDLHNSETTHTYKQWLNQPVLTSPRAGEEHQSIVAINFIKSILDNTVKDHPEHYRLYPQLTDAKKIQLLLIENGATFASKERLVGCHMGNYKTAERAKKLWNKNIYSKKTWPIENFVELQQQLYAENPNIKLVLTGSPSEQILAKKLNQKIPNVINLIGETSVLELAALMDFLRVFLTGDTGPLHIAAATNVPIVALFGPTSLQKTGPRPQKEQHIIIEENPLTNLSVATVKNALMKFLY